MREGNTSFKPYAKPTPNPIAIAPVIPQTRADITIFSMPAPIWSCVIAVTNTIAYNIPLAPNPIAFPPGTPRAGSSFLAQLPTNSAIIEPITKMIMNATKLGIHKPYTSQSLCKLSELKCVNCRGYKENVNEPPNCS